MHKSKLPLFLLLIFFSDLLLADESQDINITSAWISEAPPTVSILAAYAKIQNNTNRPKTLSSVSSPVFSKVEIHLSKITDGMATMEKQTSLMIPAENSVEFSPGNYHLMLFNPQTPLKMNDKVTIIFNFSDGISKSVQATVEKRKIDGYHHH